jgi:choline dehydrogenase
VILSGGAFNTPQLLKLSGIEPKAELEKHGIKVRVNLPGVGENLQDRYEVGIVTRMKRDFALLKGATFKGPLDGQEGDPIFKEWQQGKGVYTTNGAVLAIIKKSMAERPLPDLFIFGLAGKFKGYYPGYSEAFIKYQNYFTWAILKAHTENSAGTVKLRSTDPRDVPDINFHYFSEGNDKRAADLESVAAGVEFVRGMMAGYQHLIAEEETPGTQVQSREQIREFIKNEAWGHHASCTCKIGADNDPMAVLDSNFRVRGVKNLRVVDASAFPKIPGFFIVSCVYMISEKASDVILKDAKRK